METTGTLFKVVEISKKPGVFRLRLIEVQNCKAFLRTGLDDLKNDPEEKEFVETVEK